MAVFHKEINLTTIANRPSYHDVTADVMEASNGQAFICSP